jgi:hypothetical protein
VTFPFGCPSFCPHYQRISWNYRFGLLNSINGGGGCVGETDPLAVGGSVAGSGGASRDGARGTCSGAGAESGCGDLAGEVCSESEATSGWTRRYNLCVLYRDVFVMRGSV